MTEEEDKIPADGDEDKAPETAAERPEPASDEAPEPAGEEAEADYQALADELNDKLLRAVAELENYRRRAEKERQDTAKFAIAGFARDCLTVLDNLRRGLDSVSAEERDGNPALAALAAGMELTERELIATLERHGIEKLDPLGAPFDYDRHQAMFEVDDKSRPAGTVVEVVQPGYLLNQRLLRPAMVGVA
ncbi:MAG: nucleotide exchange factor GrpE, partial [Kiloniellales bacterium]